MMDTLHSATTSQTILSQKPERLVIALIHPSKYDHASSSGGSSYVQTYVRGVIPCNTLRVLQSLTLDAMELPQFISIESEVHVFEDSIKSHQKAFRKLLKQFPLEGTMLIVGLVGVQSNQFPRGLELCNSALESGAQVVWGGPHITASINVSLKGISVVDPLRKGVPSPNCMPPEIQDLLDTDGVVVFHGDADSNSAWANVLEEIVEDRAKNYYEAGLADEIDAPGSLYDSEYLDSFITPIVAIDTERGCPFKCKFCAAIQAHGRTVRSRDPEKIIQWVREQCDSYGKRITVLFASDNLARNPHWRKLLAGLAVLQNEGYDFELWAESDVLCNSGPNKGFLEAYAAAGGLGMFFGIESMNSKNLAVAGKTQNNADKLHILFVECRALGIAPEGGYIIGFEHDTPESILEDIHQLSKVGMAKASFFVKTMLPGSQDWAEATHAGRPISSDLNDFDSTVVNYQHELMTDEEWKHAYIMAVRTFYSMENMANILTSYKVPSSRLRLIRAFIWYRWAYLVEDSHPMIAGFYRFRTFAERRPGYSLSSYPRHIMSEAWRHIRYVGMFFREYYIFQNVILESEYRVRSGEMSDRVGKHVQDMTERVHNIQDWFRRTFHAPMRRNWLNDFWVRYGSKKWRLLTPKGFLWHVKMLPFAVSEVVYSLRFTRLLLRKLES